MSINLGDMISSASSIVQAQASFRAVVQASRIADKPTAIAFKRNGTYLSSQTVRIEFDNLAPSEMVSDSGIGYSRRGILFGVAGLDVDVWDTFVLGTEEYTITGVNRSPIGQVQCNFEAVGG